MNKEHEALSKSLLGILATDVAEADSWTALIDGGFPWVSVPSALGGTGGSYADAAVVLEAAGRQRTRLPMPETLIASWAATAAGLCVNPVSATLCRTTADGHLAEFDEDRRVVSGTFSRVPSASVVEELLVVAAAARGIVVVRIPAHNAEIIRGRNLADERRDKVVLREVPVLNEEWGDLSWSNCQQLLARDAFVRSALIGGALNGVRDLTVAYTNSRTQFGRPIGRFQAVHRHVFDLVSSAIQTRLSVQVAARQLDTGRNASAEIAAAKSVAGLSASRAAAAAHQAHGAIGLTLEYELGHFTRRLWAWRDECGNERFWERTLGEALVSVGAEEVWPWISGTTLLDGQALDRASG